MREFAAEQDRLQQEQVLHCLQEVLHCLQEFLPCLHHEKELPYSRPPILAVGILWLGRKRADHKGVSVIPPPEMTRKIGDDKELLSSSSGENQFFVKNRIMDTLH